MKGIVYTGEKGAEVLDGCAPGAGTAQTLMVRGGLAYDLDISGLVR